MSEIDTNKLIETNICEKPKNKIIKKVRFKLDEEDSEEISKEFQDEITNILNNRFKVEDSVDDTNTEIQEEIYESSDEETDITEDVETDLENIQEETHEETQEETQEENITTESVSIPTQIVDIIKQTQEISKNKLLEFMKNYKYYIIICLVVSILITTYIVMQN